MADGFRPRPRSPCRRARARAGVLGADPAAGLPARHGLLRADRARRGALRARWAGVRRREERSPLHLRLRPRPHPDPRRGPPGAGPQLLGSRDAGPRDLARFSRRSVGLRVLHPRRLRERDRSALGLAGSGAQHERSLPDAPRPHWGRLRRLRAPLADHERSGDPRVDRAAADPGQLVPAVPEPLDRRSALRERRLPVHERRRRGELQLRGHRPGREPREPLRRPARRRRRPQQRQQRRGRRPPEPGPSDACGSDELRRRDPAPRRERAAGRGTSEQSPLRRRGRRLHRRDGPAQPLPLHLPPGHERDLDRRRGLERLGRDQPGDEPPRHHRGLRLALLRGGGRAPDLRHEGPLRRASHRRDSLLHHPAESLLGLQPLPADRLRGDLRDGQLVDHRRRLPDPRQLPGGVRRRALLRRRIPLLHLGDPRGRVGPAEPEHARHVPGLGHARGREGAPGGHPARPRRQPLRRRPRPRPRGARALLRREPAADGGARGVAHLGPAARSS